VDEAARPTSQGQQFHRLPTEFPYQATTTGELRCFVTKLTPTGNALAYSTYLGGSAGASGFGIAVDAAGSAYVTGGTGSTTSPPVTVPNDTPGKWRRFRDETDASGNALVYSTYLVAATVIVASGSRWTRRAQPTSRGN